MSAKIRFPSPSENTCLGVVPYGEHEICGALSLSFFELDIDRALCEVYSR